jgi:ABC-type amino acid transport substrate-binding protein
MSTESVPTMTVKRRRLPWRHVLAVGATCIAAGLVAAGCGGSDSDQSGSGAKGGGTGQAAGFKLASPGTLTVGVYGSYPPAVAYGKDTSGTLGGIDGVLINTFAKEHGLKVKLQPTTLASVVLGIQQHKMDVGLYIYYSPERSKQVRFTRTFASDVNQLVLRKDYDYTGPDSVSTVGSGVGFALAPTLRKALGDKLKLFPTSEAVLKAVLNRQIDGAVLGGLVNNVIAPPMTTETGKAISLDPGTWGLSADQLSTADYNIVACDNQKLGDALDATMDKLVSSGEWDSQLKSIDVTPYTPKSDMPAQGC